MGDVRSVAISDFNGDSQSDLAVINSYGNNVDVLLGYGNGSFGAQTTFSTEYDSQTQSVAVGDFNGDGQLDLVVANPWTDNVGVLLGYGNGTFQAQMTSSTESHNDPTVIAVGDFNGDSYLDIVVIYFYENIGVLLGNGNETFGTQMMFSTGSISEPSSVAVAYFFLHVLGVLLGCGNGTFGARTTFPTHEYAFMLAVSDFNSDGCQDIVVLNVMNIEILLNTCECYVPKF